MSKTPSARAPFRRALIPALLLLAGAGAATQVLAHGDMVPHAVDTTGLKPLGKDWEASNPYRGSDRAKEIGATGYNQNCARCHGLDAKSGGIAPDLRYLDVGADGDEWFLERIRTGAERDGKVYMPAFEGILSQEAMWAIRTYLDSVHEN